MPLAPLRRLRDPSTDVGVVLRLMSENLRAYAGGYALAFFFMAVSAAATAAAAWLMRDIINGIFVDRRGDLVAPIAAAVTAVFVVKGAAMYGQAAVLARIGASIVARVQMRIIDRVLAQGVAFYDREATGQLTTRLSHNADAAREVINTLTTALGRDALTVVALVAVMLAQDAELALIALIFAPPAIVGVGQLVRRVRKLAAQEFAALARVVETMNETARGVRVVKAFGLEPLMRARLEAAVEDVRRRATRIARLGALSNPLTETLGGLAIAAVILYAGRQVVAGGSDPGAFFSFITALLLAADPAKRVARLRVNLQSRVVGVRLLYELLDAPVTLAEAPDARALRLTEGRVAFRDVRFAYGGTPVLDGLSFTAEPGGLTALVGPSGAGKSTVFSLIARFYDADAGAVEIDGQDVRGLTLASLRGAVALVGQDAFLFAGTIRENIRLGRAGATDAEVEAAARDANVLEFAAALPGGLDAEVGEAGGLLSGGQRQRVAIARAMLRDAPILLLDEATSALDAESEAKVQEALDRLTAGRTTLAIAHRLATIQGARRILVMQDGRVVEQGDHGGLMAHGGLYARLHALQFRELP
jgi:ATP-binding cassette subfamily B protein